MTHQWMEIKLKELEKRIKVLEEIGTMDHGDRSKSTGHWVVYGGEANVNRYYQCSECGEVDTAHVVSRIVPFCWNCGAEMVGKDEFK